jgi:excisionase family DNA binding protein
MKRLMTARQVSEYTQIPLQMIYRKTKRGDIPCYRSGRTIRYKLDEIEAAMKGDEDVKKRGTRRISNPAE